jgi:hypothetical protein
LCRTHAYYFLCSYKCIGWADPDLSPQGYREVEHAAR